MKTIVRSLAFLLTLSMLIGGCKKETMNTDPVLPTVSTNAVTSITTVTAECGGNVTSDGGAPVISKGICWDVNPQPTTNLITKTNEGAQAGPFISNITGLSAGITYYVRAYATNSKGTAYGDQIVFKAGSGAPPSLLTTSANNITSQSAFCGGSIVTDGGLPITQRGLCWSIFSDPDINSGAVLNIGNGTGNFSGTLTGLMPNTKYFVRAFATNAAGTGYGNNIFFTTSISSATYPPGTMHCQGTPTAVVDVINPATGKIWMDRNLGAIQKATSSTDADSYGDLYQWGRRADLHQCRNSSTTTTLSSSDQPANGNFILAPNSPRDWRSPQNTNLWQGVNGINNPCPSGYRLPTEAELTAERLTWGSNNAAGAIASPLKLPLGGMRGGNGNLSDINNWGYIWSSTVNGTDSNRLSYGADASMSTGRRAQGFPVRCIKN